MKTPLSHENIRAMLTVLEDPRELYPITRSMFNIGPRNRLSLSLNVNYRVPANTTADVRGRDVDRAVYFLSVLRNYMLVNGDRLGFRGIRVTRWGMGEWRSVLVESDEEWIDQTGEHQSRLRGVDPDDEEDDNVLIYDSGDNPPLQLPPISSRPLREPGGPRTRPPAQ